MTSHTVLESTPLKDAEGALHELHELSERFNNRLSLNNLALAKRYCDGRLNLLIEARWASIDFSISLRKWDAPELSGCSSINHPGGRSAGPRARACGPADGAEEDAGDADSGAYLEGRSRYGCDSVVFVENIKHVNGVQNGITSLACFERKDQCFGLSANAVYFSYAAGFVSLGPLVDRKVTSSVRLLPVRSYEVTNQIVEDASNIVDSVTQKAAKNDWNVFLGEHAVNILAGVRIDLMDQFVRLSVKEGIQGRLKISDVMFGPFNF